MQTTPLVDLFSLGALLPPELFFGTVPTSGGSFETLFQSALTSAGAAPNGEPQTDLSAILAQLTSPPAGGAHPLDVDAEGNLVLAEGVLTGLPLPALNVVHAHAQAVTAAAAENHAAASFSAWPDVTAFIRLVGEHVASVVSTTEPAASGGDTGVPPVLHFAAAPVEGMPTGEPNTSPELTGGPAPAAQPSPGAEALITALSDGALATGVTAPPAAAPPEHAPADALVAARPSLQSEHSVPPTLAFGARAVEVVSTVHPASADAPPDTPPVQPSSTLPVAVPVGTTAHALHAPAAEVPVVLPEHAAATSAEDAMPVPYVPRPETPVTPVAVPATATPPDSPGKSAHVPSQPAPAHVAEAVPSRVPLTSGTEMAQATAAGERATPLGTLLPLPRSVHAESTPVDTPETPVSGESPASSGPRVLPTVARAPFTLVPRAATQANAHAAVSSSNPAAIPVESQSDPALEATLPSVPEAFVSQRFTALHMAAPLNTMDRPAAHTASPHPEASIPQTDGFGALHDTAETTETARLPRGVPVRTPLAQLSQQVIRSAHFLAREHGGTVQLRLEPESLGRLTVKVMQDHDVVRIELTAQSQQVREVLQGQLSHLKQQLVDQGLALGELSVSVEAETQNQQAQHDTASPAARTRSARAANVLAVVAPALPAAAVAVGQLDLIA